MQVSIVSGNGWVPYRRPAITWANFDQYVTMEINCVTKPDESGIIGMSTLVYLYPFFLEELYQQWYI